MTHSLDGTLSVGVNYGGNPNTGWLIAVNRIRGFGGGMAEGFYFESYRQGLECSVYHWFTVLLTSIIASAPWIPCLRWRFSLRTLLLATTLFALALGTIVWLARL